MAVPPAAVPLAPVTLAGDIRAPAPRTRRGRPLPRLGVHRSWAELGAAVGLLALWALSLPGFGAGRSLLAAAPPLWFAAYAGTVLLYLAGLLSRRPVTHHLAACQVVLVAVLTGTASVVGAAPRSDRYPGVVGSLAPPWAADRATDPWAHFPGVPALASLLHRAGVPGADLQRWAPPLVALLTAASVYWLVGGVTGSRRVRYGAVLLVTLGDWTGQAGFSPQGLAFPLSLVVLGGLLRSVLPGADGVRWEPLRRLVAGSADDDLPPRSAFWSSRWGAAAVVAVFALVAVSSPLTAVVLLAEVAVVCALLRPARSWLALVLLAVEQAWLLPAWPYLQRSGLGLPAGDLLRTGAPWAGPLLTVAAVLLAAWGFTAAVLWRGRPGRVVLPAAIALVATAIAQVGGLALAYTAALPFLAFLAALELFDDRRDRTLERRLLTGAVVVVVALLALPAATIG